MEFPSEMIKTIQIELTVFLILLIIVVVIFAFFVAWRVATLQLRVEKCEKDINNLGDIVRMNRAFLLSRINHHQIKFNEVVSSLDLPSKLKDFPNND